MATRKTDNKTSNEVTAKKSKTSSAKVASAKTVTPKKTTVKAKESNLTLAKKEVIEAKAKATQKTKKIEQANVNVLSKKDYNPIEEVLEKKAKNEEKKIANLTKKESKVKAKAYAKAVKEEIKEKGNKANVTGFNRRSEIKENVMKAEAKKFIELKENNYKEESASISVWSSFINGYKNIFNFKGRSSRYEFWSFMAINFLFCLILGGSVVGLSSLMGELATGIVVILLGIVETIVYLSLIVRRIHDTNHSAWKGFFRPAICSIVVYFCALLYLSFVIGDKNIFKLDNLLLPTVLSIVALSGIFTYMYYALKIFIVAGFIEEDTKENSFGAPKVLSSEQKCKLISVIVSYFMLLIACYFVFSTLAVLVSVSQGIGY